MFENISGNFNREMLQRSSTSFSLQCGCFLYSRMKMLSRTYRTLPIMGHWQIFSRIHKSLDSYFSYWVRLFLCDFHPSRKQGLSISMFTRSSSNCVWCAVVKGVFYSLRRRISKLLPGWRTDTHPEEWGRRYGENLPEILDQ